MRRAGIPQNRAPVAQRQLTDSGILATPGLVAWFDMLKADTYTVGGGTVTSITNRKSGVAWSTVVTAAPLFEATGFNGRPCMTGDGGRGLMSTEASLVSTFTGTNKSYTVLYVVDLTTPDAVAAVFGSANSGATATNSYAFGTSSFQNGHHLHFQQDAADAASTTVSDATAPTARQAVAWVRAGTSCFGYLGTSRVASSTVNLGATTVTRCALLARPGQAPDVFLTGKLAECMVFNAALGQDELNALMRYEAKKWGLAT